MDELNYLGVDLDAEIYRISAAEHLLKDRQEGRLTLTRIDRAQWFDPSENGLLEAQYKTEQGEDLSLAELTRQMFGSCWSFRPLGTEEDWEGFAHGRPGIRIKSTPRKVLGGLLAATRDPFRTLKYWMGEVMYLPDEERHAFFDDPEWTRHLDTSNRRLIEIVLRVRSHWKGENEVRLVIDRQTTALEDEFSRLEPLQDGAPRMSVPYNWTDVVTGLYPGATLKEADNKVLLDLFPLPAPDDEY